MNALFMISPYMHHGMWVFDDESRDLDKEPFVAGIDDMISLITSETPTAKGGFNLIFSSSKFPGSQITLTRQRPIDGGYYYHCEELGFEGWLCPALFKYFDEAPESIHAQFKEIPQ
jgi:hypothetical protein